MCFLLIMKDYSNFLPEKPYSCSSEGCSMKFTNEDHLTVHKKRHDMILTLGLGQKGTTFSDQTPTPTQFIRNCEEVGLFQDLQNVNPFEETFKRAVEAVKSGQLSLEKSFEESPTDDTLHTPKVFPHITDMPNIKDTDVSNKSQNIPPCEEESLKQNMCDNDKNEVRDVTTGHKIMECALSQTKRESIVSVNNVNNTKNNSSGEKKVMMNVPKDHWVHLLTPEDSQSSCNMVVIKNTVADCFSPLTLTVKEKLKKNINEKKTGKNLAHKVPILKCPLKKPSSSSGNKFSKFSTNAKKLISKLEISEVVEMNEMINTRQKKINKVQSTESRSEFLARSRAASSRCREKKKMYLLYLEKINSELSTANQNLILINSLLRQEISDLRRELVKHKNCSAADRHIEVAITAEDPNLNRQKTCLEGEKLSELQSSPQSSFKMIHDPIDHEVNFVQSEQLIPLESSTCQSDPSLFLFDVAEVILNSEPEEGEIPLNEGNKPPDIIVRFNSVGNDFPATIPSDSCLDRYIERAGGRVKQIYGEHSYYLKKPPVDIGKHIMDYKTYRGEVNEQITSEECKKLSALQVQIQQNDSLRDLTHLNSKVLMGPRTPPPLILLKPFKKRSLQCKRNEKT